MVMTVKEMEVMEPTIMDKAFPPEEALKPFLTRDNIRELVEGGFNLEAAGKKAKEEARNKVLKVLEDAGVTVKKVAEKLNAALDASYQEAKLTREGEFAYSTALSDNKTRLDAVKIAAEMLEMTKIEGGEKVQVLIIDSFNVEK